MLKLIAAAVALVLAAATAAPVRDDRGYPGPEPTPAATAASSPAVRECVQTVDAPGGVETCAAWAVWAVWGDAPMPTPAPWPQAYP